MSLAAIKTGGKQYLVKEGDKLKVEKLDKKEGERVAFDQILLLEKGKKLEIGTPIVKEAKVTGKVIRHGKGKKVIAFKYRASKRYKVKKGHRQQFTEVQIEEIKSV